VRVVLYVGRLSREYKADLEPLIRAFGRIVPECPSALLLIAGSTTHAGSEIDEFPRRVQRELQGRVVVIQDFSPVTKRILYGSADLFISPVDNVQESFGLTLLEAMASKLPVIASDWSGYRELIRHGKEGFLLDTSIDPSVWTDATDLAGFSLTPATEFCVAQRTVVSVDQMTQWMGLLLSDPDLRQRMGDAGHERVRNHYTWSRLLPRFSALWDEQVRRSKTAAPTAAGKTPDLSKVFRPYATEREPNSAHFFVHTAPNALVEYSECHPEDREGIAILERCADSSLNLSGSSSAASGVLPRIYRLLKQGYLVAGLPGWSTKRTTSTRRPAVT